MTDRDGPFARLRGLTDRAARLTALAGGADRAMRRARGGSEPARSAVLLAAARQEEALMLTHYGMNAGRVTREMRPRAERQERHRAARHRQGRGRT